MAEEQLNLIDNMTPSLRRIYQEAEKLNRRMLTLRSNIKALEKPASLSYMRRELKTVEQQAKQTERAIKAMKAAEAYNAKYGAFKIGAQGSYYLNGRIVPNANRGALAEAYVRNVQMAQLRRNRQLWDQGRLVNGLTFEQRVQARKLGNATLLTNPKGISILNDFNTKIQRGSIGFDRLTGAITRVGAVLGSLAIIGYSVRGMFESIIQPTNKYLSNYGRLNLTSDRNITPKDMMNQLYDTAIRTRSDAQGTMMLYNRIAMSGVKASNERIRRFVETFNKTMMISGTSGQENRAVMLQLAQGMGSNRLGGDEFRSIAEQAPMFKYMLARGMGVNPGALKQMGAEGKLTADAIMKAMERVQDLIDKIAQDAPLTVDQTFVIIQAKWEKFLTSMMSGYISIRNLLQDFSNWMDTPQGQTTLQNIIRFTNTFILRMTAFLKWIARPLVWVVNHIDKIAKFLKWTIIIVLASKWEMILMGVVSSLQLIQTQLIRTITGIGSMGYVFMNAGAMSQIAMTSMATNIKSVGVALHTWVPELLIILGLMLAITKLIPAIKNEIDTEKYINDQLRQQGFTAEDIGKAGHYQAQQKGLRFLGEPPVKMTKRAWDALRESERLREQYKKEHPKEGTQEWYKLQEQKSMSQYEQMLKSVQGVMNSNLNVPMPVEPKKGKLDSVGRINDDINLNKDSLEMLKAVAERTWIMQNEVTVPQKVDVNVNNISELEPESIANMLNEGSKIAIASSMRGSYA